MSDASDEARLLFAGQRLADGCANGEIVAADPPRPKYIPPHLRKKQPLDNEPENFSRWGKKESPKDQPVAMGRSWACGDTRRSRETRYNGSNNPFDKSDRSEDYWNRQAAIVFAGAKEAGAAIQSYDLPVEVTGDVEAPSAVDNFNSELIHSAVRDNIARAKYSNPTPVQKHSIPIICHGNDLMSCAQTGSGKTAAFLIPIVSRLLTHPVPSGYENDRRCRPAALVLSPTRELAMQIHKEALKFTFRTEVRPVVAYGGANMRDQVSELRRGCELLIATPGRLVDMMERGHISLSRVQYLCLDEADRMLDMGFEPQVRRLVEQADMPYDRRQTLMFSATFSPIIQRLATDFLKEHVFLTVGQTSSTANNITQRIEFVESADHRDSLLLDLLYSISGRTIIFVETKRRADELEYWLTEQGRPAVSIHGDREQREREAAISSFRSGQTPYLVATDVAARGLDVPEVMHVINYELPRDIDSYVHRIGRTGRAGNTGVATAFMGHKDARLARDLLTLLVESQQEVPDWLESMTVQGSSRRQSSFHDTARFRATDARQRDHPKECNGPAYQRQFGEFTSGQAQPRRTSNASSYWDD